METRFGRWLVCLISFVAIPMAAAADPVSSFANLPAGDEIHIQFLEQGCFHQLSANFRFSNNPSAKLAVVRRDPRHRYDPVDFVSFTTGTLILSAEDVGGLDRLLEIYRGRPTMGSATTMQWVTFTQIHDAQVIATESFRRSAPISKIQDLLTFNTLARRL